MDKKEAYFFFFFWKLHIVMVWLFLDNELFIRLENLKASLNLATNFSEKKGFTFRCFQMIYTLFDS